METAGCVSQQLSRAASDRGLRWLKVICTATRTKTSTKYITHPLSLLRIVQHNKTPQLQEQKHQLSISPIHCLCYESCNTTKHHSHNPGIPGDNGMTITAGVEETTLHIPQNVTPPVETKNHVENNKPCNTPLLSSLSN